VSESSTAGLRDEAGGPTISESIAACWSAMSAGGLPGEAVAAAKRFILDTLACSVAGARTEAVGAVMQAMQASGQHMEGPCSLWGRKGALPADRAALVNGTAAHALELDDFGGCGHSGAVVVPAVLAVAEQTGASGRDVVLAVAAGYDVAARVLEGAGGYRRHNDAGWHSSGTCGSFGAAAGVAKLLGLDASGFASALGVAGSFTGGIWAFLADGAMTKRFHPGKAAETGVCAAYLAAAGMTGSHHVLDAPWGGFFSTYAPGIADPSLSLVDLGRSFRILRSGIKPYACCRTIHAPIDSLLMLMRDHAARADGIEAIIVHGNRQTVVQFDRPSPKSMFDAQFSMQYCLALAALHENVDLKHFEALQTGVPAMARLMAATSIVADRTLGPTDYPAVELVLEDGRRGERQVSCARGHADNPLADAEVESKARSLMEPILGAAVTREVVELVGRLERLPDIRRLSRLLSTG
jgi:2-methylcitrate dehydratase PrpD